MALLLVSCDQESKYEPLYLGQVPPGPEPELFALGVISLEDRHEFGFTFSQDGKECFLGVDDYGHSKIFTSRLIENDWAELENIFPEDSFSHNDPILSPDGQRLYYISNRPLETGGSAKDYDIWYSKRQSNGWSAPINAGGQVNTVHDEYYASFTAEGTLYFGAKDSSSDAPRYAFDIYCSKFIDGEFQPRVKLPESINTDRYEADVFIAPDESYMIFCAIRADGLGDGDLYISFKDSEGNWSEAQNMGEPVNSALHELCPFVSANGKYLFYTSNQDVYWVSTSIFDRYRP